MVVSHSPYINGEGVPIGVWSDPLNPSNKIIHVAWGYQDGAIGESSIYYSCHVGSELDTRGYGWETPLKVSGAISVDTYNRSMAVDGLGCVHITFSGGDGLYYSRSNDGGVTFDEIATLIVPGVHYHSIAADSDGNVFLSYKDQNGTMSLIKRLVGASSWTTPVVVSGSIGGSHNSIAVYDANRIYISWRGSGVYVARTSDGGSSWSQHVVTSEQSQGGPSLTVGSNGVLNIAWQISSGGIAFSRSTNEGRTWTSPVLVDPSGVSPNSAVDNTGKVHIMFFNADTDVVYSTKEK